MALWRAKDKDELWGFIAWEFGVELPREIITPGHSTPFDFVADAYFNPGASVAAWASRGGGKTLSASLLAACEYVGYPGLDSLLLAGKQEQAKILYEYMAEWLYSGALRHRIDGKVGRKETRFLDGGHVEILPASDNSVRGPHIPRLYQDEIDSWVDTDLIGTSIGMLSSRNDIPARRIVTSTWQNPNGPMGQLTARAASMGLRLHKWNVWESIKRCPAERHDHGRNCDACPIGEFCLGKARQLKPGARVGIASKKSLGLEEIDDIVIKAQGWSRQQWDAEAECKRPTLGGMVYPQFDRAEHVIPDLNFDDALPTYRAIDFGVNGFVCLWIQEDKRGRVYVVDEYCTADTRVADCGRAILEQDKDMPSLPTFVDPAGRNRNDQTGFSDIQVLKSMGIDCRYTLAPVSRNVHNGISMIRGYLRPAVGKARLYVAGACKTVGSAFESYKLQKVNGEWIDEPVKPQACDHPMDALRYYFVNRHSPARTTSTQVRYS